MEDIFEKEIKKYTVFKNKDVLSPHYLPDKLPHREKQIDKIMKTLAPILKNSRAHNLFIYGKTGVGKTASVKHVLKNMETVKEKYNVNVRGVIINCVKSNSKYQIMLSIAERCYPNENFSGYSFAPIVDKVMSFMEKNNLHLIVVLDEIDKVKTELDELIYTLTRINDDLRRGSLTLIGISNRATFKEALDPRSKSSLCEEELVFPPYDAEQLEEILRERVVDGYKKGSVDASAIRLAAALAAQESGDARYALKLITKAGEIADDEGSKRVTDRHVEKARKKAEEEIIYEIINTLPEHQKIVLYAVALLSKSKSYYKTLADGSDKERILFTGEIYDEYKRLCKQRGRKARSSRWCKQYINDLEMLGLLTTSISGKGVRGTTTLVKLDFPPENIERILKRELG